MPATQSTPHTDPRGAGVRSSGEFDSYYAGARRDLRALFPVHARSILDVGCGGGALAAAFKADVPGAFAAGIEGFPEAAARARTCLDLVLELDLDRLESLPEEAGTFDVITFGDVLEHLLDPERLVAVLTRYLNPGGAMVMSIPNHANWSVVAPLVMQDVFPYEDSGLLDRTHVHFYTLNTVSGMCDRLGLEVQALTKSQWAPLPREVEPLMMSIARVSADPREALGRAGAYQYLLRATRVGDRPATPVPAVPAPRLRPGGLGELVPTGHVRVELGAGATPRVLDDAIVDALAAAPGGAPRAFVLDGSLAFTRDPERVLGALTAELTPDDVVVLAERNVAAWSILGALAVDDEWDLRGHGPVGDHPTRLFTATSLRALLEGAGLTVHRWEDESDDTPGRYGPMLDALSVYSIPAETVHRNLARRVMRVQAGLTAD